MSATVDKTALSYWFPVIEAAGIPVPRTTIIDMPKDASDAVIAVFDGRDGGNMTQFMAQIDAAACAYGYPCFLRTDHTSGKHGWDTNCFLDKPSEIGRRVCGIVEYSEMAGMFGLPWTRWAVRDLLPTNPVGVCEFYGNMPICREFRFFVADGKVVCRHPYWPLSALERGGATYHGTFDYSAFCAMSDAEDRELTAMAEKAGVALGGAWSVDFLETERGWFLTDMAEAHKSYHWDGCLHEFRSAA
jgi:hypothetical protein